jgi:ankyrin repeat protein/serine/threonine protein kinase
MSGVSREQENFRAHIFTLCENEHALGQDEIVAQLEALLTQFCPNESDSRYYADVVDADDRRNGRFSFVHEHNEDGKTPLLLICEQDEDMVDVVKILVDRMQADVNDSNQSSLDSPLMVACMGGNVGVVEHLLASRANPNGMNRKGLNPLFTACAKNNVETVALLLKYNADVNALNRDKYSVLHLAASARPGNPVLIDLLVAQHCDINARTSSGCTPLLLACQTNCNEKVLECLVLHGADPNISNDGGVYPLTLACHRAVVGAIRVLVGNHAEINNLPNSVDKPLHLAIQSGIFEIVKLLVEHGASLEEPDAESNSPLLSAVLSGQADIAEFLISRGASTDILASGGYKPMLRMICLQRDNDELLTAIMNVSHLRQNPIRLIGSILAKRRDSQAVYAISYSTKSQLGASPNPVNKNSHYFTQEDGCAYLMAAVSANMIEIACQLVEAGADFVELHTESEYFRGRVAALDELIQISSATLLQTVQSTKQLYPVHVAIRLFFPIESIQKIFQHFCDDSNAHLSHKRSPRAVTGEEKKVSPFVLDYHQLSAFQVAEICSSSDHFLAEILSLSIPICRTSKEAISGPYDFKSTPPLPSINRMAGMMRSPTTSSMLAAISLQVNSNEFTNSDSSAAVSFPTCRLNAPIHIFSSSANRSGKGGPGVSGKKRQYNRHMSFSAQKVYFECHVANGTQAQVGLAMQGWSPMISEDHMTGGFGVGDSEGSVSFDGFRRCIWNNGAKINIDEELSWKSNCTIGVVLTITAEVVQQCNSDREFADSQEFSVSILVQFFVDGDYITEVDWIVTVATLEELNVVPACSINPTEYVTFDFGTYDSSEFERRRPKDSISVSKHFRYRLPRVLEIWDSSVSWLRCVREDSFLKKLICSNSKYNYFDWIWCVSHDKYSEVIKLVLKSNPSFALPLSNNCCDLDGRRAIDVATPRCRAALEDEIYLFGRFEIADINAPLHESKSTLVVLGYDHASNSGAAPFSRSSAGHSASHTVDRVALKLMKTKDKFDHEMSVRELIQGQFTAITASSAGSDGGHSRNFSRSSSISVVRKTPTVMSPLSPGSPRPTASSSSAASALHSWSNFPPFVPILCEYDGSKDSSVVQELAKRWGNRDIHYCIIMPVCERTLHDILIHEFIAGLNWKEIKHILSQLCQAVSFLHSLNILHGDIKPLNIVRDSSGHIKLIDFDTALYCKHNNYLDEGSSPDKTAVSLSSRGLKTFDYLTDVEIGKVLSSSYASISLSSAYIPPELALLVPAPQALDLSPDSSQRAALLAHYPKYARFLVQSQGNSGTIIGAASWDPLITHFKNLPWLSHDIWSLGAVFYEVCCGTALFQSIRDNVSADTLFELALWSDSYKLTKLDLVNDDMDNFRGRNLISQMLSGDCSKRPNIVEVQEHPFFTFKWVPRFRNEEPQYDIFLSYRVDTDLSTVQAIYERLIAAGYTVWWDKTCLLHGEVWNSGFCQGLMSCKVFVPVISRAALFGSRDCRKYGNKADAAVDNVLLEYRLALELKEMNYITRIYPIFVGDGTSNAEDGRGDVHSRKFEHFDFKTYGAQAAPDVVIDALEAELLYHLDRSLGLGFPTQMGLSVRGILERIFKHQGFIKFIGLFDQEIVPHLLQALSTMFSQINSSALGSARTRSSSATTPQSTQLESSLLSAISPRGVTSFDVQGHEGSKVVVDEPVSTITSSPIKDGTIGKRRSFRVSIKEESTQSPGNDTEDVWSDVNTLVPSPVPPSPLPKMTSIHTFVNSSSGDSSNNDINSNSHDSYGSSNSEN